MPVFSYRKLWLDACAHIWTAFAGHRSYGSAFIKINFAEPWAQEAAKAGLRLFSSFLQLFSLNKKKVDQNPKSRSDFETRFKSAKHFCPVKSAARSLNKKKYPRKRIFLFILLFRREYRLWSGAELFLRPSLLRRAAARPQSQNARRRLAFPLCAERLQCRPNGRKCI